MIDSTILTTDTLKNNLRSLIGFENREFRPLHRGTRDGFTCDAYHGKGDGAGQVLMVAKTDTGYIMGAYAERRHENGNILT